MLCVFGYLSTDLTSSREQLAGVGSLAVGLVGMPAVAAHPCSPDFIQGETKRTARMQSSKRPYCDVGGKRGHAVGGIAINDQDPANYGRSTCYPRCSGPASE